MDECFIGAQDSKPKAARRRNRRGRLTKRLTWARYSRYDMPTPERATGRNGRQKKSPG